MNTSLKTLIQSSLTIFFTIYGSWYLFSETFYSFLPFGIIFTILFAATVHFLRVAPADQECVEAIMGPQLHLDSDKFKIRTIAHRGAGLDAPENTLSAFKMCKDNGCEAIEFDVALTSDDVPVVYHDNTLERMANSVLVVKSTTYKLLSKINISEKHPYEDRFPNTNIPTLEQVVTQLLASGQKMIIDLKDPDKKMVKVILNIYEKHEELYSRAVVSSFFPQLIYQIRRNNPKIVGAMAWRPHIFTYQCFTYPDGPGPRRYNVWYKHYMACVLDSLFEWALPRILYYLLGLSIILLHKEVISGETILNWRSKGVRVMAWTVNSPTEKQHLARNFKIPYLTDTLTGESSTHTTH